MELEAKLGPAVVVSDCTAAVAEGEGDGEDDGDKSQPSFWQI